MIKLNTKRYRSIFISDFHIGAKTFNAPALLDFLKHNDCDTLYLVGDIIDGWKLKKRWLWSETINEIFDELARKAHEGTQIIYLPGNHDDSVRYIPIFRRMRFMRRLDIKIAGSVTHKTADGRKFLVMHGDQFDTKILSEPVLKAHHKASDWLSSFINRFKPEQTFIEVNGTVKRFSLAKYLSKHGRIAIQTLNNFEGMVYRAVKAKHADGIICGHTHIPVIKTIRDITYINTGSWLRAGNTAVVEQHNGRLDLLDWDDWEPVIDNQMTFHAFAPTHSKTHSIHLYPDAYRFRPATLILVKKIQTLWGPDNTTGDLQPQPHPKPMQLQTIKNSALAAISLPFRGSLAYDTLLKPQTV